MNKVFLDGKRVREYEKLEQFEIKMMGDNNYLELHSFEGEGIVYVYMRGTNNVFRFGKSNTVKNSIGINFWAAPNVEPNKSQIIIGDNNFFNGSGNSIIGPLTTKIVIGDGNLFAGNITVWGRNDHIVYDVKTKKRLNKDVDVDLGSNNWICEAVTILPGASLRTHSVVALGCILNKSIDEDNVLIAGVPAQVKKRGINWSRACKDDDIDYNNNLKLNLKEEYGF